MASVRRTDLDGHPSAVAPLLLGAHLTSLIGAERVVLRVTEVEAYGGVGEDPGSHAFRRQTPRNATMFGPSGHAYVYFTYGMHWCFCVVTGAMAEAGAILVRAGEIVGGLEEARMRRPSATRDRDLARGPARLTSALGITGAVDGVDLFSPGSPLSLRMSSDAAADWQVSARTGVGGAGAATPWRYFLAGDPTVSPYRKAAGAPRVDA